MVVVAIAGILMALLLPALSQAKEKSRRSVCSENIRQVLSALTFYGMEHDELLPPATDNTGVDYHSIVLSDFTFSTLMSYLSGESNCLYCPNLVDSSGKMGGYNPKTGYTIGYSYLAAKEMPETVKGPDPSWIGPVKTTETIAVIADANYWNRDSTQTMSLAPHGANGSVIANLMLRPAAAGTSSEISTAGFALL